MTLNKPQCPHAGQTENLTQLPTLLGGRRGQIHPNKKGTTLHWLEKGLTSCKGGDGL